MRRGRGTGQPGPLDLWLTEQAPEYLETLQSALAPFRGASVDVVRAGLDRADVVVPEPHLSVLAARVSVLREPPASATTMHTHFRVRMNGPS